MITDSIGFFTPPLALDEEKKSSAKDANILDYSNYKIKTSLIAYP